MALFYNWEATQDQDDAYRRGGGGADRDGMRRGGDPDGYGGSARHSMRGMDPYSSSLLGGNSDDERYMNESVMVDGDLIPMFELERVEYTPPHRVIGLQVCNGIIAMGLENGNVIRLDISRPHDLEDIRPLKKEHRIHNLFLCPRGKHLLVSMTNGETYYLHTDAPKPPRPKLLARFKGILISAVAWDKQNNDASTTRRILIGTEQGVIHEAQISGLGREVVLTPPLHRLSDVVNPQPITGLAFERCAGTTRQFLILATIAANQGTAEEGTVFHHFVGGPSFSAIFANHRPEVPDSVLLGCVPRPELSLFSPDYHSPAEAFAFLTGTGVYFGDIKSSDTAQANNDNVLTGVDFLEYVQPLSAGEEPNATDSATGLFTRHSSRQPTAIQPAQSLGLTEFHFLLLYPDRFEAICRLSRKRVMSIPLEPFRRSTGNMGRIVHDPVQRTWWIWAEKAIFEVKVADEDRYMWQLHLERNNFSLALSFCKTPEQKDQVLGARADHYFDRGHFLRAASYYGLTNRPFEEIALKFVRHPEAQLGALKKFLEEKLSTFPEKDETQRSLLCTWLTELYLDEMDELEQAARGGETGHRTVADVRRDFEAFLIKYDSCLHQQTTFSLISEHGRVPELLTYAKIKKDYDTVISHYVQSAVPDMPPNRSAQERYDLETKHLQQALRELLSVEDAHQAADLFYKYSPLLMARVPYHTVNAWLKARDVLSPPLLIPSLMRYKMSSNPPDHPNQDQAIRYLQYAVGELRCRDKSVHNYLVYLLTQKPEHEVALRAFLGDERSTRFYDLEYALRQCLRHNRTRAVVLLYAAMGMYEQAVERALKVDIDLAMQQARKPADNAELRKKLWLRIARHCVENGMNKQAMGILEECHLLSIDDILPFFPDFDRIDDVREPICHALSSYNQRIAGLIYRMDQATASAGLIREDIKLLRRKHCFVQAQQECDLCQCALMSSPFYVFACQHVFHADCLGRAVKARLDAVQREQLAHLEEEIARESILHLEEVKRHGGGVTTVAGSSLATNPTDKTTIDSRLNELQEQLEAMIAEECIYCSNYTISEVDQPFVDEADQKEIDAWSVV